VSADSPAAWEPLAIDPAHAQFPARAVCGGQPIWVLRTNDGFRGIQETCPHDGRPLESATIVGNGAMVRCIYHNYTFKLSSGAGVNCPGFRIAVYDIREHDGQLFAAATP